MIVYISKSYIRRKSKVTVFILHGKLVTIPERWTNKELWCYLCTKRKKQNNCSSIFIKFDKSFDFSWYLRFSWFPDSVGDFRSLEKLTKTDRRVNCHTIE